MSKLKVVFIYSRRNYFLSGRYSDNHWHNFFMVELHKNPRIDVLYIETNRPIDCARFKHCDVLLFYSPHTKYTPPLINMQKLTMPKFAMSGDAHNYFRSKKAVASYGDVNYFFMNSEEYFYEFFPKYLKYKQVIPGVSSQHYTEVKWSSRDSMILNTGVLDPKPFYVLRQKCSEVEGVRYIGKKHWLGNNFPSLLTQYKAAISACTQCFTLKHLEVCFANCVPFLEVTQENGGFGLGFKDYENAIFINEVNYEERLLGYLSNPDLPLWKNIANKAKEFVENRYTPKHGVESLVEYMYEVRR